MKDRQALELDQALVGRLPRTWPAFFARFGRFTPVQRQAIPHILEGSNVLITAATAAGKTEAGCVPLVEARLGEEMPWYILYVAPTRALVNDIKERLLEPLKQLGVRTVRRTGDHKDGLTRSASVIVTTPESFESILCSRGDWFNGLHPLALVSGVVLDEIHLLQANPRGEQVRMLLERLRRLRRQAKRAKQISSDLLQIVALSATLTCPHTTVKRFLGQGKVVEVPGTRELEIVSPDCPLPATEAAIVKYVESLGTSDEKILVFCNSRRRVDDLTAYLKGELDGSRYQVHAHHGSLGQGPREEAERAAKELRRILLVATSTLELGVDIGDIDLVVLDGPAPDVSALLQRLGRGGRRTSVTRLMLCASSVCEMLMNSAMVECAMRGDLGPPFDGPNFAVLIQQVACFILQGKERDKSREKIVKFLEFSVERSLAEELLTHVVQTGLFVEEYGRIRLGQELLDKVPTGGLYVNIESDYGNYVVDDISGGVIASGLRIRSGASLNVGGVNLQVKSWEDNRILVKKSKNGAPGDAEWSYSSRAWARGPCQPYALRRYLGISSEVWPIVASNQFTLVFHLGGSRRQAVINLAARCQGVQLVVNEWLIRFPGVVKVRPDWLSAIRDSAVDLQIADDLERLETKLARPRANQKLPLSLRIREVREWLSAQEEVEAIKASQWKLCNDPEVREALSLFGSAVG